MKEKIRIMVVEDEILVGLMIAKKLRENNYEVGEVVTSGEEAIERANISPPDIILMDVALSGDLTGIDAGIEIKNNHGTPIVLFSGYDQKALKDKARELAPVAVVSKLGNLSEILDAIKKGISAIPTGE